MRYDYISILRGTATPRGRTLEFEIGEAESVGDSLQKEMEILQTEADKLERMQREKEELSRKLQFQCEESEEKSARHLRQNKKNDEQLEQYKCEIQEFKLKQRKQRIKFENQLHQLMEQHKILNSMFTLESLPDEIGSAENTACQLLSAEEVKLAQLAHLNKEIEAVKDQEQFGKTDSQTGKEPDTCH
ncbi:synaptonemal complex central element protein 1-like isoform X3 [Nelusetta ayraudi]|uniref:synaptonemal complex central element protein 1-like isoform X3 n=1 Tax=Nelusetta ayraudi TaxID=303726 RepID=UPI003F70DA55